MINELTRLTNLKTYFIRILGRFSLEEDFITGETRKFVDFIKNWDFKQYSQVVKRPGWN